MARTSPYQRSSRCLKLIFGMQSPSVLKQLKSYGLNQETIDEGWRLLKALSEPVAEVTAPQSDTEEADKELQAAATTWLPLCRAVLHRQHREQEKLLFEGLVPTRGRVTPVVVQNFLTRLRRMAKGDAPFLEGGIVAHDRLCEHGLDLGKQAELGELVEQAWQPHEEAPIDLSKERGQAASDALWAWYLEWSAICRAVIKNKDQLRSLGFDPRRSATDAESKGFQAKSKVCLTLIREKADGDDDFPQQLPALSEPTDMQ